MHSALKRDGRPLYELARQGLEVEREAREVHDQRLALVEWDPRQPEIEVECSKRIRRAGAGQTRRWAAARAPGRAATNVVVDCVSRMSGWTNWKRERSRRGAPHCVRSIPC